MVGPFCQPVAVSSSSDQEARPPRACAADGFIAKPFQIDTILDAFDYHVRAS